MQSTGGSREGSAVAVINSNSALNVPNGRSSKRSQRSDVQRRVTRQGARAGQTHIQELKDECGSAAPSTLGSEAQASSAVRVTPPVDAFWNDEPRLHGEQPQLESRIPSIRPRRRSTQVGRGSADTSASIVRPRPKRRTVSLRSRAALETNRVESHHPDSRSADASNETQRRVPSTSEGITAEAMPQQAQTLHDAHLRDVLDAEISDVVEVIEERRWIRERYPPAVAEAGTCPSGHTLLESSPHGHLCDGCQRRIMGDIMHSCRRCDFDLCQACIHQAPINLSSEQALQPHFDRQASQGSRSGVLMVSFRNGGEQPLLLPVGAFPIGMRSHGAGTQIGSRDLEAALNIVRMIEEQSMEERILRSVLGMAETMEEELRTVLEMSALDQQRAPSLTPATECARSALPSVVVTKEDLMDDITARCPVCFEKYSPGMYATRMLCGHLFCTSCIWEWLSTANSCPVCRYELPTENQDFEVSRLERMHSRKACLKEGDLHSMSIPQLKQLMRVLHVTSEECVEKADLIQNIRSEAHIEIKPDRGDLRYEEAELKVLDLSALRSLMKRHNIPPLPAAYCSEEKDACSLAMQRFQEAGMMCTGQTAAPVESQATPGGREENQQSKSPTKKLVSKKKRASIIKCAPDKSSEVVCARSSSTRCRKIERPPAPEGSNPSKPAKSKRGTTEVDQISRERRAEKPVEEKALMARSSHDEESPPKAVSVSTSTARHEPASASAHESNQTPTLIDWDLEDSRLQSLTSPGVRQLMQCDEVQASGSNVHPSACSSAVPCVASQSTGDALGQRKPPQPDSVQQSSAAESARRFFVQQPPNSPLQDIPEASPGGRLRLAADCVAASSLAPVAEFAPPAMRERAEGTFPANAIPGNKEQRLRLIKQCYRRFLRCLPLSSKSGS